MLDVSLQRVRRTLLRDEAYRLIRDAIVAGTLAPDEVVRDATLAGQLGLSRAPVREALARLSAEGLVESKPQSYTRVTPLILDDVRDAVAVIRTMHELATRTAVPVLTVAAVVAMRQANERFASAVRSGDVETALAADDMVHDVLIDACGNRALSATIERYNPLIRRLERQRFATLPGQRSIHLHEQLINACAAGDTETAVAVTGTIFSVLDEIFHGTNDTEAEAPPRHHRSTASGG
jgi:DNA-binding GntR family transcriptional regulator